jgi:hypothetical protein
MACFVRRKPAGSREQLLRGLKGDALYKREFFKRPKRSDRSILMFYPARRDGVRQITTNVGEKKDPRETRGPLVCRVGEVTSSPFVRAIRRAG